MVSILKMESFSPPKNGITNKYKPIKMSVKVIVGLNEFFSIAKDAITQINPVMIINAICFATIIPLGNSMS